MEPAALGSDYVEFHSGVPLLLPSSSPDREIHKTLARRTWAQHHPSGVSEAALSLSAADSDVMSR